jgi:WD40 repeat protein
MAVVFRARDLKHERQVAIKVMRLEASSARASERFLREIGIVAKLDHPNILELLDSGTIEGLPYFVMPYVGPSLRDRLKAEVQLPLEEAIRLSCEVADALGHAHEHGIIHRDIKPENILLQAGHAVVADFGIARATERVGQETLTQTGTTIGTPKYMSPEQGSATETVDGRADIYALGCVLYEMLAGSSPFEGATPRALLRRHLMDPVPSLRTVRATVPNVIELTIAKALEKAPADRYQTAQEFAAALRAYDFTATTKPRRRSPMLGIYVGVAILTIAAAWLATRALTRDAQPSKPTLERLTMSGDVRVPSISGDGRYLAYLADDGLMVADLRESFDSRIAAHAARYAYGLDLKWGPRGVNLYFSGILKGEAGLFEIPRLGGATHRLGDPSRFGVSPDGRRIAVARFPFVVIRDIRSTDGSVIGRSDTIRIQSPWKQGELTDVDWNPSGDRLLVANVSAGTPERSEILDVAIGGSSQRNLLSVPARVDNVRWGTNGDGLYFTRGSGRLHDVMRVSNPTEGSVPQVITSDCVGLSLTGDGRRIVCTRRQTLYSLWLVRDVAGGSAPVVSWEQLTSWEALGGVSTSPDGQWIAYVLNSPEGTDLYRAPIRGGVPDRLTQLADVLPSSSAWSPDGKVIALTAPTADGTHAVWFVSAGGGEAVRAEGTSVADLHGSLSWAPGPQLLFVRAPEHQVHILQSQVPIDSAAVSGSALIRSTSRMLAPELRFFPSWSPDETRLAAVGLDGIWVMALTDEAPRRVLARDSKPRFELQLIGWSGDGGSLYVHEGSRLTRPPRIGGQIRRVSATDGTDAELVAALSDDVTRCVMVGTDEEFICERVNDHRDAWMVEGF